MEDNYEYGRHLLLQSFKLFIEKYELPEKLNVSLVGGSDEEPELAIYYIDGKRVHIVDSWPVEDTRKVSEIEIDGWGQSLFLKDDKLVVFSRIYNSNSI